MQQLSGSSGRGGTKIPAMYVDFACLTANRSACSAGPISRDPNIMRAFSCAVAGGGVGSGRTGAVDWPRSLDLGPGTGILRRLFGGKTLGSAVTGGSSGL